MSQLHTVMLWLLCSGCSVSPESAGNAVNTATQSQPTMSKKAAPTPPDPVDVGPIDTGRISQLTLKEAVTRLGKPFEQLEYDFPNENAAGIREGLLNYIPIDSKKQVRIKQLTWKRGRNLTTVFYRYQKGDWRPLDVYLWKEGDEF